jgi:hypothetical protein
LRGLEGEGFWVRRAVFMLIFGDMEEMMIYKED